MSCSGHISRWGFLALAGGLLVPAPPRVRAYSFLPEPGFRITEFDYALVELQIMKALRLAHVYGAPLVTGRWVHDEYIFERKNENDAGVLNAEQTRIFGSLARAIVRGNGA